MKVLVIDTALGACTAAVFEDDRALATRSETMTRGHQERLGGMVRDVVAEAGGGFAAVDRIGVTVGPGSFTGLRVGIAFALGLGAALDRPVVGISTLAALAWSADGGEGPTAAAIDARRGQVYLQTFREGEALIAPQALSIAAMRERLAEDASCSWRLAGGGMPLAIPESMKPGPAPPGGMADLIVNPTPGALAALTIRTDPATAPPRPLYLRAPDATPPTRLPGQPRPVPARP